MQKTKKPRHSPGKSNRVRRGKAKSLSAQQTVPYLVMHPDGVCQLPGGIYTKTVEYEDINYSVASTEDQTAIFGGWSSFLNYFDCSLPFQLSFVNRRSRSISRYKVNIPAQEDDYNSIRGEFVDMLKNQIAKSNNGIVRSKYITFGLPADGIAEAKPRLERVESDVIGNLSRLGVPCEVLDGRDRLAVLHGQMHPGSREPFRFSWKDIPQTGMGTKDFIAPDSFDFRQSRTFRVGQHWGAASYLQILASELSDKLLAEILELDAEVTVTMHVQTVDQLKAIKMVKGKISDIGRMKVEEQKKAVRAGYDMDILPPDLITFSKDAAELLSDLQSRKGGVVLFLLCGMVLALLQSCMSSVITIGQGAVGAITASTYVAEDEDLLGAEEYYCSLEAELQDYLDTYEHTRDYDEYHYDLDEIKHDPYVLLSIVSALHEGAWTLDEVQGTLDMLAWRRPVFGIWEPMCGRWPSMAMCCTLIWLPSGIWCPYSGGAPITSTKWRSMPTPTACTRRR